MIGAAFFMISCKLKNPSIHYTDAFGHSVYAIHLLRLYVFITAAEKAASNYTSWLQIAFQLLRRWLRTPSKIRRPFRGLAPNHIKSAKFYSSKQTAGYNEPTNGQGIDNTPVDHTGIG